MLHGRYVAVSPCFFVFCAQVFDGDFLGFRRGERAAAEI